MDDPVLVVPAAAGVGVWRVPVDGGPPVELDLKIDPDTNEFTLMRLGPGSR